MLKLTSSNSFYLPPYVDNYFFRGGLAEYAALPAAPYFDYAAEDGAAGPPVDENTQSASGSLPDEKPAKTKIRTDFPETWLWSDYVSE